jgi:hypothetical protein
MPKPIGGRLGSLDENERPRSYVASVVEVLADRGLARGVPRKVVKIKRGII